MVYAQFGQVIDMRVFKVCRARMCFTYFDTDVNCKPQDATDIGSLSLVTRAVSLVTRSSCNQPNFLLN